MKPTTCWAMLNPDGTPCAVFLKRFEGEIAGTGDLVECVLLPKGKKRGARKRRKRR